MRRNRSPLTVLVPTLLLFSSPVLFAADPGLLTYDEFLASRGLNRDAVECINAQTEDVLNPHTQGWDNGRAVCEVWTKEKITPGERLTFKDGSPVYMAVHEWTKEVPRQETLAVSGEFVVRQDVRTIPAPPTPPTPPTAKRFKRYVTRGN